jgi:hypothetical protein
VPEDLAGELVERDADVGRLVGDVAGELAAAPQVDRGAAGRFDRPETWGTTWTDGRLVFSPIVLATPTLGVAEGGPVPIPPPKPEAGPSVAFGVADGPVARGIGGGGVDLINSSACPRSRPAPS